jgi:sulfur carrier protein ThiS
MKIEMSFYGPIRRPWPETTRQLEVAVGASVEDLLADLGYEPEDLKRVAVVVNGRRRKLGTRLAEGDDVRFALLAGGG